MKNSREETRVAHDAPETVEAQLGALKDKQAQMAEEVKQALKAKASAEAGLKTTERQVEDLRKELHYCEINLATEKQLVKDLREEIRKAKEAAQLLKEAAEAEKQAAYALGVQETQLRTLVLLIYLFSLFIAFVCCFFFFLHVFHPHYQ